MSPVASDARNASAGYTLMEMLVALSVIGLSFAGLGEAGALMNRFDRNTRAALGDADGRRRLQSEFSALMADQGPFMASTASLTGDSLAFHFPCSGLECSASIVQGRHGAVLHLATPGPHDIPIPRATRARFSYVAEGVSQESWPPVGAGKARLTAVELQADEAGHALLAHADLWRDEPRGCDFDAIQGECRSAAPPREDGR